MAEKKKVFSKWDITEIKTHDKGLERYVSLEPRITYHTHGRKAENQFKPIPIIEKLMNTLMRSSSGEKVGGKRIRGRKGCGKKSKARKIVKKGLQKVEEKTDKNPLQVLVNAIENAAPREETTRVKQGGITKHVAVDISPLRRISFGLRNIGVAVIARSFDTNKSASEALADELIHAANNETDSLAIKRKNDTERVARGAR